MEKLHKYLSTKIRQSKIKASNFTLKNIVKSETKRLGYDADLNHIDVSFVTDFSNVFNMFFWQSDVFTVADSRKINVDISKWDMSNAEELNCMFYSCRGFNCDISEWAMPKAKDFSFMFNACENFDIDISGWDMSSAEKLDAMFQKCTKFNQPIGKWNTENVESIDHMFFEASSFCQDLSSWDLKNVYETQYGVFPKSGMDVKFEFWPKCKKIKA